MMREHKLLEPKALLLYLFLPFSTIYATAPPFTMCTNNFQFLVQWLFALKDRVG
jgi:hypothetical protein